MNKIKKLSIVTAVILGMLGSVFISAKAETYDQFSVQPVIPENQIDKSKSYFDLLVHPEMSQEIQVSLTNTGNETMNAEIVLNDATTGNNGVIIYSTAGQRDESLTLSATDVVSVIDSNITIEPGTTGTVRLHIQMPSQEFDGNILGGIVIKGHSESKNGGQSEGSIQIDNEVAYVVGLNLSMNQNKVVPNLNLTKVKEELVDHRTSVIANLQNDQAVIMKDVKIEGTITKKGSTEAISNVNITGAKIAPNSNFNVVYDWNGKKIQNGSYRIQMTATAGEDVWTWDEEFVVNDASGVNEQSFFINEGPNWLLIIGGTLSLGVLLGLLVAFIAKKKKKDNEEK